MPPWPKPPPAPAPPPRGGAAAPSPGAGSEVPAAAWLLAGAAGLLLLLRSRGAVAADEPPAGGPAELGRAVTTPAGERLPRGIRNHNPGNLRPGSAWRGLADPSVDDANYLIFTAPRWGIRAMAMDLLKDFMQDGQATVRALITEWAPSFENPHQAAYIAAVARALGVEPDDALDLVNRPGQLEALVRAIIRQENGQQPYSSEQIALGVADARAARGVPL